MLIKFYKYGLLFLAFAAILSSCSVSKRFASDGRSLGNSAREGRAARPAPSQPPVEITTIKPQAPLNAQQQKIISEASEWLGTPYLWGGNTKKGVDCSGFVKNIYGEIGISLPRTAQQQYNYAQKISDSERVAGDLLFYQRGNKISHVAIYIGNDEIIHSASGKGVVRQSIANSYLQSIYVGAGRILTK